VETALYIGLANVAVAVIIALVAIGAGLIRNRPALSHALWLLVLLKLLTPPLWNVPIHTPWNSNASLPIQARHIVTISPRIDPIPSMAERMETSVPIDEGHEIAIAESARSFDATTEIVPSAVTPSPAVIPSPSINSVTWLSTTAFVFWLTGSIVCAVVIGLRIFRFHRLLRFATLASPALQSRTQALAYRMGVARAPRVWFIPGAVCPMLWPLGRGPRLLIPGVLWDRLGEGERSSLLAHELAHLRRRDHWVRGLEVLASVLYWWCPLVWFARRRLRQAEEQCCDAWVVWAIPGSGRDYASALLEAVEFISTGSGQRGIPAHQSLPMLASGMGQFHQLKRRLVMIKTARIPKTLSGAGFAAVSALALALLPLAPTRAQVDPAPKPETVVVEAPAVAPVPKPPVVIDATVISVTPLVMRPGSIDAEVITELKSPTPSSEYKALPGQGDGDPFVVKSNKIASARDAARMEVDKLSRQLERARQRLAELDAAAMDDMKRNSKLDGYSGGWQVKPEGGTRLPAAKPPSSANYESKPNGSMPGGPGNSYNKTPKDPNSRERRLDQVEANLKALLEEVRSLRNDPSTSRPPEVAPAPK
jgi:beta-lactamase regulating signal transducer with metallopeptidase domain